MAIPSMSTVWEMDLPKRLGEVLLAAGIPHDASRWGSLSITGISEDSRQVRPGYLFVAIPGQVRDGADFIDDAIDRGAVAILSERSIDLPSVPVVLTSPVRRSLAQIAAAFYEFPTRNLFTVGVTGTNGKTTTCHWAAEALGRDTSVLLSTVTNVHSGISGLTTPPSPVIQEQARNALSQGAQHLILEASSAGLAQDRLASVDFDVAVLTSFSAEHVQHHRGIDAYRRAKLRLFEELKPTGWAVLNIDDPFHEAVAAATRARILTYGWGPGAAFRAESIEGDESGSQITGVAPDGARFELRVPMPGRHNVSNALAALSVGWVRGLPLSTLTKRLARSKPVTGRAYTLWRADGVRAMIDFAHNPSSLEAVLSFLRTISSHIIVVFGCPGDGEHEKRSGMGEVAGRLADAIVLTSDNPKHEDPLEIAREIRSGIRTGHADVRICIDRQEAIRAAVDAAQPGSVVLVTGKGHEAVQLVGNERIPHNDADVLRDLGFGQGTEPMARS